MNVDVDMEISRLQLQRDFPAATTTAQEPIPYDIVKLPCDICDNRVGFGGEDECKAIILKQVSEALRIHNRDEDD